MNSRIKKKYNEMDKAIEDFKGGETIKEFTTEITEIKSLITHIAIENAMCNKDIKILRKENAILRKMLHNKKDKLRFSLSQWFEKRGF